MNQALSIKEVSQVLGRTEKTVRGLVRRGELEAIPRTGGQGVAYRFTSKAVERYRTNSAGAELLARCLFGLKTRRISTAMLDGNMWEDVKRRPYEWHFLPPLLPPPRIVQTGGKSYRITRKPTEWTRRNYRDGTEEKFPAFVPSVYATVAKRIAGILNRGEMDFLCAVIVAMAHPRRAHNLAEYKAITLFHGKLDEALAGTEDPKTLRFQIGETLTTGNWEDFRKLIRKELPSLSRGIQPAIADAKQVLAVNRGERGAKVFASAAGRIIFLERAQSAALWRSIRAKFKRSSLSLATLLQ